MTTQAETALQNRIRLELSAQCEDVTHFRNHTGVLPDGNGGMVRFGLGPGSPDLVGWKTVEVTEDMVGQKVAVFFGLEIKRPGEKPRPDQRHWLAKLSEDGGIAGCATSVEEAVGVVS